MLVLPGRWGQVTLGSVGPSLGNHYITIQNGSPRVFYKAYFLTYKKKLPTTKQNNS